MIQFIKILFIKLYYNLVLLGNGDLSMLDKTVYYLEVFKKLGPVSFLLGVLGLWFTDNKEFFSGAICLVLLNMAFGMIMHKRKNTFNWDTFFEKTLIMIFVIIISYITLEIVISIAGKNGIINGLRAAIQASTLLLPGSKILKNVFILSNGEHPPEWIMKRLYNFKKNGDLAEFLSSTKNKEDLYKDIEKKAEDIKENISSIKDLDEQEFEK